MKILTVENLSRAFGGIKANEDISFEVEKGQVLGVIGPNGLSLIHISEPTRPY